MILFLSKKKSRGDWPSGLIERELARWKNRNSDGKYEEYCQVAVYYLEKKLKRA